MCFNPIIGPVIRTGDAGKDGSHFRILRYKGTKILYVKHFGIRAERLQPVRPSSRQEGYNESIDGQTGHFERA